MQFLSLICVKADQAQGASKKQNHVELDCPLQMPVWQTPKQQQPESVGTQASNLLILILLIIWVKAPLTTLKEWLKKKKKKDGKLSPRYLNNWYNWTVETNQLVGCVY